MVGPIGLIVGVSCLLCSSALPGVWSFLRVTPCESRRDLQFGPAYIRASVFVTSHACVSDTENETVPPRTQVQVCPCKTEKATPARHHPE